MSSCCSEVKPVLPASSCCGDGSQIEPGVVVDSGKFAVMWAKLGIAMVLAGQAMVFSLAINRTPPEAFSNAYWIIHGLLAASALAVCVLLGPPLLRETVRQIRNRRLTVEVLFVISIIGAFVGSLVATFTAVHEVYYEVVAIVLSVYTLGRTLNVQTRSKVAAAVEGIRQQFDTALVKTCCGKLDSRSIEEVDQGDEVVVHPGGAIPVDGEILEGEGYVRETALTGEPVPVVRRAGNRVLAGTFAVDGTFRIRTSSAGRNRHIDTILGAVESARFSPSRLQLQADRIVQWFVPAVVTISIGTFLGWLFFAPWTEALFNSMAVLLVACPCALGLATPLAIWSGLQRLSQLGIVARSAHFLDALARVDCCFFDKTGTLSEGALRLDTILLPRQAPFSEDQVRDLFARLEEGQSHPVARAVEVLPVFPFGSDTKIGLVTTVPAQGIHAEVTLPDGTVGRLAVGNEALVSMEAVREAFEQDFDPSVASPRADMADGDGARVATESSDFRRRIFMAWDGEVVACLEFSERLRLSAKGLFPQLRQLDIQSRILTGDGDSHWRDIDGVELEAGLSADEKLRRIDMARGSSKTTLFIGDGINDAAAMAAADASIAIDESSALTRSTSHAVMPGSALEMLPLAIRISRKVRSSVYGNLVFAAAYNFVGISMAVAGILDPVVAALLMLASSVTVSLRAIRSAQLS